jgi:hypothetical protein
MHKLKLNWIYVFKYPNNSSSGQKKEIINVLNIMELKGVSFVLFYRWLLFKMPMHEN